MKKIAIFDHYLAFSRKRYKIELYLQRQSCIWSIERRHFQRLRTIPNPDFKVTPLFDDEYLRNGTRYRHGFNGKLIGTHTRAIQGCHWVSLSVNEWLNKIFSDTDTQRPAVSATAELLSFILHSEMTYDMI